MSDYRSNEAQGLEFAKNWKAAGEKAAEEAKLSTNGYTGKSIPEAHADMLRAERLICNIHSGKTGAL